MFTPGGLFFLAKECEERYRERLAIFPPGTFDDERNRMWKMMEEALECAEWMEQKGFRILRNVGPFMMDSPPIGSTVVVRAGSLLKGTDPALAGADVFAKRATHVVVRSLDKGWCGSPFHGARDVPERVRQAQIVWSGTGRYWRHTDLNNIEVTRELEDASVYVNFGDVSRKRLGMQCQYGSDYVDATHGARSADASPYLAKGLRILGRGDEGRVSDYHRLRIHRDDVEAFVENVARYKLERGCWDQSDPRVPDSLKASDLSPGM